MAEILMKNIYKSYDGSEKYSVTDFNLDIKDKEFIVFVGPSGCGKSTTLRMIAGLEEINKGELWIDGKLVNELPPKDRNIAMVFQNYALYPHMSVYDNMAYGLKIRKQNRKEIDEKVRSAAEILGLTPVLKSKPAALSGGQRQRVALGRSIVRNASVFLMDEPLSNLDAKLRVQMRSEILKLHQNLGTTTIYVTHDQTEAMTMATRIVVMKDGLVQQIGTPIEVYDNPSNKFVAGFMGSPAMNFFEMTYQDGKIHNGQSVSVSVTEPQKKKLDSAGHNGKRLFFGIRPEDIHTELIYLDSQPQDRMSAEITVSELLGSETMLYLTLDGSDFVAKVDSRDYATPGEKIDFVFDMNKAHFFDIDTEKVIK